MLGDRTAPVATVCTISPVAKLICHQPMPQAAEAERAAALSAWLGKSVARKAWYHDIECVRGISAMGGRGRSATESICGSGRNSPDSRASAQAVLGSDRRRVHE